MLFSFNYFYNLYTKHFYTRFFFIYSKIVLRFNSNNNSFIQNGAFFLIFVFIVYIVCVIFFLILSISLYKNIYKFFF